MNANLKAPSSPSPAPTPAPAPAMPRFDAKFIEDNQLIDRYLERRLPVKGARELENWCRANPAYLEDLKLAARAEASLQLLESSGRPVDLSEPTPPWWRSPYVLIGLGVLAALCVLGFWVLFGKYILLREALDDTRTRMHQGSLEPPATTRDLNIAPDRAANIDKSRIAVSRAAPQLIDLHIDMNYTKDQQFRMIVDKQDQGRALILSNLVKDSNGELSLTFNTTGLAAGTYNVRIEALPFRGSGAPNPEGWLTLIVN